MNCFETGDFIFVHRGINPDVSTAAEDVKTLQWVSLGEAGPHASDRTAICGHTMQGAGSIADLDHTIYIDTGLRHYGLNPSLLAESSIFREFAPRLKEVILHHES